MSKKGISVFQKVVPVPPHKTDREKTTDAASDEERLVHELASAQIEKRFREGLASGKIPGDMIILDEKGNPVKSKKSDNIFDL